MKPSSPKWLRFRITLLLCLFSSLFLVVFGRAYQLQILQGNKLAKMAEQQYQRVVSLVPRRGIIFDRKKEELAISVEVDSVFAQPPKVEDVSLAAWKIAPILGKRPEVLLRKLKEEKPFVWLERGITKGQRETIEGLNLSGIEFLEENKRFYPQGRLGAPVIGFAGVDSQGLEGVELSYGEFIRGDPGYMLISRDARGRAILSESSGVQYSEEGCEVILTLDKNIQYVTEKELKKAVQAYSAKRGMAVVMNPKTGEILAMAQEPSFDLNHFSTAPPQLWKNSNITDVFEPGSTFKTFLLAAALEEKVVAPRDVFFCENGSYTVGDRVIHDSHKHGWLSLGEVIRVSSNIGAGKVGRKLGRTKFHRYCKSFGFGAKTEIDLPGEVSGFLPSSQHWSEVGLANISFGQGVSLTALQLATAISAIANGGDLMRPYVVKTVLDRQGNVLRENQPRAVRRVISRETARTVTSILKSVTEEGGTGKAAGLVGYEAAGKTGTAQKVSPSGRGYSDKRVASFIGFAPADNPQVVIVVIIDEPEGTSYGGVVAAPAFKAIGEQVLPYMGTYPQGVTYLANAGSTPPLLQRTAAPEQRMAVATGIRNPSEAGEIPGTMPDFSGKTLRQVMQSAQRLGLELKLEGSGKAVFQNPAPGQGVQAGTKGLVRFQPTS
ncbi:MAG: penicillin-binding transpeptidase domain-containing protein [Deltaproteobacteria bacterium]|nr:penicillin-binding transpeptidase domain-containing protein [Deltaproteobacteria bacterium]